MTTIGLRRSYSLEDNGVPGQTNYDDDEKRCIRPLPLALIVLAICLLALAGLAITVIILLWADAGKTASTTTTTTLLQYSADGNCVDLASNCAEIVSLCPQEFYSGMMHIYCRKTCGFCESACEDKDGYFNRCQSWKRNRFCTNDFYNDMIRREYCAKTCGLCQ